MSKEELLRIYSAYLPYELQVLTPIWRVDKDEKTIQTLHSLTKDDLRFKVEKDGYFNCWFEDCKPVLFSMDMLTQPIEHKGQTFIPIERIQEEFELPENFAYLLKDVIRSLSDFFFTKDLTDVLRFQTVIDIHYKLVEWHFNIFNLPDSAYIKKENLKK